MRSVDEFSEIYLYREPVDMRKSIGGFSALAEEVIQADWSRSQLFIFANKKRTVMSLKPQSKKIPKRLFLRKS